MLPGTRGRERGVVISGGGAVKRGLGAGHTTADRQQPPHAVVVVVVTVVVVVVVPSMDRHASGAEAGAAKAEKERLQREAAKVELERRKRAVAKEKEEEERAAWRRERMRRKPMTPPLGEGGA